MMSLFSFTIWINIGKLGWSRNHIFEQLSEIVRGEVFPNTVCLFSAEVESLPINKNVFYLILSQKYLKNSEAV